MQFHRSHRRTVIDQYTRSIQDALETARNIEARTKENQKIRSAFFCEPKLNNQPKIDVMHSLLKLQWIIEKDYDQYLTTYKEYKKTMENIDNLVKLGVFTKEEMGHILRDRDIHDHANKCNFKEELEQYQKEQKKAIIQLENLQKEIEEEQELKKEAHISMWEEMQVFAKTIIEKIQKIEHMLEAGACCPRCTSMRRNVTEEGDGEIEDGTKSIDNDSMEYPKTSISRKSSISEFSSMESTDSYPPRKRTANESSSSYSTIYRVVVPPHFSSDLCKTRCVFCDYRHLSNECGTYMDIEARLMIIKRKRNCHLCLNYHPNSVCRRQRTDCSFCKKLGIHDATHHAALCKKPKNRVRTKTELIKYHGISPN